MSDRSEGESMGLGDADNLRERRGGRRLPGGDDRGGDRRGAVARLRRLVFRHSRASVF